MIFLISSMPKIPQKIAIFCTNTFFFSDMFAVSAYRYLIWGEVG